jgi:ubiquinone/menaquinone biosynthesis C-methylase UbiE
VPDGWADVVISNGVLNLLPDKVAGLKDMYRALKSTGRLQIADIMVSGQCRMLPSSTSIYGRGESLALCWMQSFKRLW